MRGLKICLWATGILCLLCVFGMFLPISTLESFTKLFGIESLTGPPPVTYAIRVTSAMCVGIGVFFIILALDPMKYGVMVLFSGIASVFVGLVCAITGLAVKMPLPWFLGDTLSCLVPGVLILLFQRQAKMAGSSS
jgi:hypothetical protein